jgi:DNA-binding FadR family transcriptional regulator
MPSPVKIRPLAPAHKLSRGLFEQLAEQIKSGRLAPGSRLPTEEALTRAARVSRTVVREAVAALRARGSARSSRPSRSARRSASSPSACSRSPISSA